MGERFENILLNDHEGGDEFKINESFSSIESQSSKAFWIRKLT